MLEASSQPADAPTDTQDIFEPEFEQSSIEKECIPGEEEIETSVVEGPSVIDEMEPTPALTQKACLPPELEKLLDLAASEERIPKRPSDLQPIFNWFAHTQIYAQIRILILIIGVGFLVKLAADMGWFPIEARLASAALWGVGLAIVDWTVRKRAGTYGLILHGGGIGIIYLTTYGTYQIYGFIGPTLAFGLFVGLSLLTIILSLLNDARNLSLYVHHRCFPGSHSSLNREW